MKRDGVLLGLWLALALGTVLLLLWLFQTTSAPLPRADWLQ